MKLTESKRIAACAAVWPMADKKPPYELEVECYEDGAVAYTQSKTGEERAYIYFGERVKVLKSADNNGGKTGICVAYKAAEDGHLFVVNEYVNVDGWTTKRKVTVM